MYVPAKISHCFPQRCFVLTFPSHLHRLSHLLTVVTLVPFTLEMVRADRPLLHSCTNSFRSANDVTLNLCSRFILLYSVRVNSCITNITIYECTFRMQHIYSYRFDKCSKELHNLIIKSLYIFSILLYYFTITELIFGKCTACIFYEWKD